MDKTYIEDNDVGQKSYNNFSKLDNNLLNHLGSYLSNSKDILNLTQASKEMRYLFQETFLTASFGFANEKNIKKKMEIIKAKNKINSLHFSNCRGIDSCILLDLIREVNSHNLGKDRLHSEMPIRYGIANKSQYIGREYTLSSLLVEKCFSVRDDILNYLQQEESISLEAIHLCDLSNVKLSYMISPTTKPKYSFVKVLGLTNSTFAIDSNSLNQLLNERIPFTNVLLREIIEGSFPSLEALFLGGCKNFILSQTDNRFLPLLNVSWSQVRTEILTKNNICDDSMRVKRLRVSPRLKLIEHSFVDEDTINNFVSLIRIGQEIEYDMTLQRNLDYKGIETIYDYLVSWNAQPDIQLPSQYEEQNPTADNNPENFNENKLSPKERDIEKEISEDFHDNTIEKELEFLELSRGSFIYPKIILFDFYYETWHERQNIHEDRKQRYKNEIEKIHRKNASLRMLRPEVLEATIGTNTHLKSIEGYLRTSLQAATRSLDTRNQTIMHKCMSFESDSTKALASWCLKQEIPLYAKDNKGHTVLNLACDTGIIYNVNLILDYFRNCLYPTNYGQDNGCLTKGTHTGNMLEPKEEENQRQIENMIMKERRDPTLHIDGFQGISCTEKNLTRESSWISAYYRFHKDINLVKVRSHRGDTPLYIAALKGNEVIVALLLNFIWDLNKHQFSKHLVENKNSKAHLVIDEIDLSEYSDHEGYSPMHAAAIKGSLSTVKALLQHPAVNAYKSILEVNRHQQTSLHLALRNGNMEVVEYLFEILLNSNCFQNTGKSNKNSETIFSLRRLIYESMSEMKLSSEIKLYLKDLAKRHNIKIDIYKHPTSKHRSRTKSSQKK